MKHTAYMWAIVNHAGVLYRGSTGSRRFAIQNHAAEHVGTYTGSYNDALRDAWKRCRLTGDRCVKITVTYEVPDGR